MTIKLGYLSYMYNRLTSVTSYSYILLHNFIQSVSKFFRTSHVGPYKKKIYTYLPSNSLKLAKQNFKALFGFLWKNLKVWCETFNVIHLRQMYIPKRWNKLVSKCLQVFIANHTFYSLKISIQIVHRR